MLSKNFDYMFDYNFDSKCLRIVQTEDQKVLLELPKDLISLSADKEDIDSVRELYAKVCFLG